MCHDPPSLATTSQPSSQPHLAHHQKNLSHHFRDGRCNAGTTQVLIAMIIRTANEYGNRGDVVGVWVPK